MQRVVDDSQRAADIISRIRTMAAGRAPKHAELSLNEVIQESILFLQREFQSNGVQVSVDLQPLGMQVRITGDRTQLQQVFVNLAINAVHAMAQSSSARRLLLIQSKLADSETVCCTIEDSGPGIDPGHQSRLFDGFFTTKESGMGMGLPISRSIIEAHGGIISAANQSVHGGARFKFKLPITRTIVQ
jgi:C4-dicarboxylate-specific signal transduction histidine kinase